MIKDYLKESRDYIKIKYSYSEDDVKKLSLRTLLSLVEAKRPDIYERLKKSLRDDGYII